VREADKIAAMKIGNLELSSPLILSPMAGISDLPFRMLNRRFGCELAFTEMISARAFVYRNSNTMDMLRADPSDRPLGIQLLGNDPEIMARAVELLHDYRHDLVEINAACPVAKITRRGEGSALLNAPQRLTETLKAAISVSKVPVSLKMRTGWDQSSVNAVDIACMAQEAGVAAVFVHGRTREQGYSGEVDYDTIRKIKEALTIPVIGNGNAFSSALIKRMFDETGCDGVGIARGCLGNPWIFREAGEYLKSGTLSVGPPSINEIIETMTAHLDLSIAADGEESGVVKFRKLFAWYVKGLRETREIRTEAFRALTRQQMVDFISMLAGKKYRSDSGRFSHYKM
jgi:tRNA-dihydrouridine synthase B